MKILVTGGTGFLGYHLRKVFIENTSATVGINNSSADVNFVNSNYINLLDQSKVNTVLFNSKYTHIIHLAASVGGIGANKQNPGKFAYENLMMGCNIIEAARQTSIDQLIMVGTVCSYPSETPVPFSENDLWNGYPEPTNAPYGIAKKALWSVLDGYYRQYNMKSAYLIPVNMYGEHDNFSLESSHVIPALINKILLANDTVTVWGTGKATREFVYAGDVARAIYSSIDKQLTPDPINIGSGEEISMLELTNLIIKLCNKKLSIVFDDSKPDGQMRRLISSEKAKHLLNYKPLVNLKTGLTNTINWYKETQKND